MADAVRRVCVEFVDRPYPDALRFLAPIPAVVGLVVEHDDGFGGSVKRRIGGAEDAVPHLPVSFGVGPLLVAEHDLQVPGVHLSVVDISEQVAPTRQQGLGIDDGDGQPAEFRQQVVGHKALRLIDVARGTGVELA